MENDRNAKRTASEKMLYEMEMIHKGRFYERSLVTMVRLVGECGYTVPAAYEILKLRPRMFQLWTLDLFGLKPAELIHRLAARKEVKTRRHFELDRYVQFSPEIVRKIVPLHYATACPELFENDPRWLFGALRKDGTGMMILRDGRACWFNYAVTDPEDYVVLIAAHPKVHKELDQRNLASLLATITE